ncbi:putative F0F1-ATPase subunit (Ca2+/Mg2+ transporter) [Ichthyenterobacterium magnum]|uniref:Putative F0F1-ATPase subunit (Ca2+/Mg2+ transporter) n=2 Tax=Ichthyenterobacterium magnum TaxID=1230530 RepID=A0A420DXF3_9FLAO|nr:putative F0F1-ATPase subunit (Ca2+/Mg2+ transporter) [Ichthyenterobacterium magnum]
MQDNKPQSKGQKKSTQLKNVAILSGIGIEMGAIIYGFVMLGKWLDNSYNDGEKMYIIICTLLGVAASLFIVVKQLNRIHK